MSANANQRKELYQVDEFIGQRTPMEGVEKKQYQTAIVLAGKEIMYQGYQQSDILRIY